MEVLNTDLSQTIDKKRSNSTLLHRSDYNSRIYSINKNYKLILSNHHLKRGQVLKIFNAGEKAYYNYTPLNRFFTIHYNDYIEDIKRPQKLIYKILENTRKWLTQRKIKTAYVWVLENGEYKGIHTHIMLHIPEGYQIEYKKALKRWLPFEWSRQRVDVKRTQYPLYGDLHPLSSMYGRLRYICKGVNPEQAIKNIDCKYQGEIFGKRFGISKSLK